ncbi:MAG: omptin family outer membrane protease [Treponema sp.]|jgi:outer membrane protease|nr:omptin family outer membrane protease [Treponema sp.]
MKIITALALLVITGTSAVNHSVSCQEQEKIHQYAFSTGPLFGFASGQALEVVYPENTKAPLMSELRWDMKPLYYIGARLDIDKIEPEGKPAFFSSLSFKAGIPADSGIMEDRDWLSKENSALTHFSSHSNETSEFYWLDITAGVSLPVKTFFYIKPFLSGSWMRFSYAARDGYGKYAKETGKPQAYFPIDDDPYRFLFSGAVIRYTQNWLIAAAGFAIGVKFPPLFTFDLSFQISPLSFCIDRDEHLLRNYTYIDYTGWGVFIEPAAKLIFAARGIEFSFEYAWRYISNTKGETLISDGGEFFSLNSKAGAGLSLTESRTVVKIRL